MQQDKPRTEWNGEVMVAHIPGKTVNVREDIVKEKKIVQTVHKESEESRRSDEPAI